MVYGKPRHPVKRANVAHDHNRNINSNGITAKLAVDVGLEPGQGGGGGGGMGRRPCSCGEGVRRADTLQRKLGTTGVVCTQQGGQCGIGTRQEGYACVAWVVEWRVRDEWTAGPTGGCWDWHVEVWEGRRRSGKGQLWRLDHQLATPQHQQERQQQVAGWFRQVKNVWLSAD